MQADPERARRRSEERGDRQDGPGRRNLNQVRTTSLNTMYGELTFGDMDSMSGETGALPHQPTLLREERRHLTTDKLVAHRLLAVRIELVGVGHFPSSSGEAVVVRHGLERSGILRLLGVEGISVLIFGATDLPGATNCINLEDSVIGAVDVGVHAETEQVLVVVGVDTRVDFGTPALGILTRVHRVGVQNSGQLDVELDSSILVEDPVHAVLIVGGSEDVGNDQLPATGHNDRLVPKIGVLEQDTSVLFVNANRVLYNGASTSTVHKCSIHVVDGTLAVAAQRQTVRHVAASILAQVERVFTLMRVLRVSVGNHHLGERQTVEHRADVALVIICDVIEHDTLAVVEANVDVPVLPVDDASVHLEGDTLGLGYVDRLQIGSVATFLLDRFGVVIVGSGLAERSSHRRNVNVNDLLCLGIVDRAKIQGKGVLRVIDMGTVVHECLLQANIRSEPLIVSDCPSCRYL